MSLSRKEVKADRGRTAAHAGTFERSFKYAVIAYAVVEFIAIALLLYHKAAR